MPRDIHVLALSFFPAFDPPTSGGENRTLNLYRELSRYCPVDLITSSDLGSEEECVHHARHFREWRIPKDNLFGDLWAKMSEGMSGADISNLVIAEMLKYPGPYRAKYYELYRAASVIIHDFPYTQPVDAFWGHDAKPRIYLSHNFESELASAILPNDAPTPLKTRARELERAVCRNADMICATSTRDRDAMAEAFDLDRDKLRLIPNGVAFDRDAMRKALRRRYRPDGPVVFVGSGHAPNQEAAAAIIEKIAPAAPDFQFVIAGGCKPAGRYGANVEALGVVSAERLDDTLSNALCVLNPMMSGSGTNIKVLECFKNGAPLVSTPFGLRGLAVEDGVHALVRELADMPEALQLLRDDLALQMKMGRGGFLLCHQQYSWRSIVKDLKDLIDDTLETRAIPGRKRPLLVLNDYDFSTGRGGGSTRIRQIYSRISVDQPVVALCLGDAPHYEHEALSPNFTLIKVPKTEDHRRREKEMRQAFHVSSDDIVAAEKCARNPDLLGVFAPLAEAAQAVICSHPYLAPVAAQAETPLVYESHNNEQAMKASLLKGHPEEGDLVATVGLVEDLCLYHAGAVTAVAAGDLHGFSKRVASMAPGYVSANGAAAPLRTPRRNARAQDGRLKCVFIGSAHIPNITAARRVLEIAAQCDDVDFTLVGGVCECLGDVATANVHLLGEVDDEAKSAVLHSAHVGLNPMTEGGGTNLKVADYLAHGLQVLSTPFGIRGYSPAVRQAVLTAELDAFATLLDTLTPAQAAQADAVALRQRLFQEQLSWDASAAQLQAAIEDAAARADKPRMLITTYRYSDPSLGGGEQHMLDLIKALSARGAFNIDVAAIDVDEIVDRHWLLSRFNKTGPIGRPSQLPHVRWRAFKAEGDDRPAAWLKARAAERDQADFLKAVRQNLRRAGVHRADQPGRSGILWGWARPQSWRGRLVCWAEEAAAIEIAEDGRVTFRGVATQPATIVAKSELGVVLARIDVKGEFRLRFAAQAGVTIFEARPQSKERGAKLTPISFDEGEDALFGAVDIEVNGVKLPLHESPLDRLRRCHETDWMGLLHASAVSTRCKNETRLTDLRGPFSVEFDRWVTRNVGSYDLLLTHNVVFRSCTMPVARAVAAGVPTAVVGQAHFDDDYYHFPDLYQCLGEADVAFMSPQSAVDFSNTALKANAVLHQPGVSDLHEFSERDRAAFQEAFPDLGPFVLVLGRKSLAKNYHTIIQSFQNVLKERDVSAADAPKLVLIGPDEDGITLEEPHVAYLGRQPREVVRGALLSCEFLVNMSPSESFGMVVVEAWRARKAVIVNKACQAFVDLVRDGVDGVLATADQLAVQMQALLEDPARAARLGAAGYARTDAYDYAFIAKELEATLLDLVEKRTAQQRAAEDAETGVSVA